MSVDPLAKSYPWYTPYQFAGNSPIANSDLDGGEPQDFKNKWVHKDLFDISSKQRIGGYILVTDPQLGKQPIDVRMVYDNWKKQTWFIHKDDQGSHFYLKNENGDHSTMSIDPKTNTLKGGHFEKFETQDNLQAKYGVESADMLAVGTFGIAAIGTALPAASYIGGAPLLSTNELLTSKFAIGAGSDLLTQYAQGGKINWLSVGASGYFSNPFTGAFGGSTINIDNTGNIEISSSASQIVLGAGLGGLFGSAAGKVSSSFSIKASSSGNEKAVSGIGQGIINFWAGFSASTMQKELNSNPTEMKNNESK